MGKGKAKINLEYIENKKARRVTTKNEKIDKSSNSLFEGVRRSRRAVLGHKGLKIARIFLTCFRVLFTSE